MSIRLAGSIQARTIVGNQPQYNNRVLAKACLNHLEASTPTSARSYASVRSPRTPRSIG
ncbi:predicted protein [Plenodomus lingam JN3]|uniref:Uncharacterized protein n=1 Tax=Leptosphaeria maculans (strain JN3 / isolate v23.1.3 / race Av1-4-5-6-7-8) TaxID=985895 RepID=M1Z7L8_LEPMJ|nr:predicted protein [Plenodomus lingam JN3]